MGFLLGFPGQSRQKRCWKKGLGAACQLHTKPQGASAQVRVNVVLAAETAVGLGGAPCTWTEPGGSPRGGAGAFLLRLEGGRESAPLRQEGLTTAKRDCAYLPAGFRAGQPQPA